MAPKPKSARFEFTVGMVLAMALTILAAMTWAAARPSLSLIFHPQLPLLYSTGRPAFCLRPRTPVATFHKEGTRDPCHCRALIQWLTLISRRYGPSRHF